MSLAQSLQVVTDPEATYAEAAQAWTRLAALDVEEPHSLGALVATHAARGNALVRSRWASLTAWLPLRWAGIAATLDAMAERDPDPLPRAQALHALVAITRGPAIESRVTWSLTHDPDPTVRREALAIIRQWPYLEAGVLDALSLAACTERDPDLRIRLLELAVQRAGPDASAHALVRGALADATPSVRSGAVALIPMATWEAGQSLSLYLRALVDDTDIGVRATAVAGLLALQGASLAPEGERLGFGVLRLLEEEARVPVDVQGRAIRLLGHAGPSALQATAAHVAERYLRVGGVDPTLRREAVHALLEADGLPEGVAERALSLVQAPGSEDRAPAIRLLAVALEDVGDEGRAEVGASLVHWWSERHPERDQVEVALIRSLVSSRPFVEAALEVGLQSLPVARVLAPWVPPHEAGLLARAWVTRPEGFPVLQALGSRMAGLRLSADLLAAWLDHPAPEARASALLVVALVEDEEAEVGRPEASTRPWWQRLWARLR